MLVVTGCKLCQAPFVEYYVVPQGGVTVPPQQQVALKGLQVAIACIKPIQLRRTQCIQLEKQNKGNESCRCLNLDVVNKEISQAY